MVAGAVIGLASGAQADFAGAAVKVDAKQNAAGVVLSCISTKAVIEGYSVAWNDGTLRAALNAGCVKVPDGAVVMVDCDKTNKYFAYIKFKGREGWTSYDHLTEDLCPNYRR